MGKTVVIVRYCIEGDCISSSKFEMSIALDSPAGDL